MESTSESKQASLANQTLKSIEGISHLPLPEGKKKIFL